METAIAGARAGEYAGAVLLFGLPAFAILCQAEPERGLALFAAALTALATIATFGLQTVGMAGSLSEAMAPGVLGELLTSTGYGVSALVRLAACAGAAAVWLLRPRAGLALACGLPALGSLAWGGHGAAAAGLPGALHLSADLVHLLAAGLWLGALAGLLRLQARVRSARAETASLATALQRFSGVGGALVALLLASGLINGWMLVGPAHWRETAGDAYGRLLIAKIVAFAAMLVLAGANRFVWTPRLARGDAPLTGLRATLLAEGALGAAVLAAVAVMGVLIPTGARG